MNRRWIILTLFTILAFGARMATDIHFKAWKSPSAMEHRSIAQALVNGKGFTFGDWGYYGPTSVQSPPFPFLLAGLFKVFHAVDANGHFVVENEHKAYITVMVINALAGAGLVWLTYLMTRTLGGTPLAGLIAAGLVAIWPSQIYAARFVQAISLITCGLAGMIILFYRSVRSGKAGPWTGFSVLSALVTLIEPVFLPGLILSGGLMLICRRLSVEAKLRNAMILGFAIIAIIGPWSLRNYIVHGQMIPIKGSFWVNMWKGNNDYATGTDRLKLTAAQQAKAMKKLSSSDTDEVTDSAHQYDMLDPSQRARLANHPEAERELVFKEFALTWIKAHPHRYLELCEIRLLKTLTIDWDNPRSVVRVYKFSRYGILLLSILGLFTALRNRWSLVFPALLAATALASYTLTVTAARFAFPFEPIQLALAGGFIAMLLPDSDRALKTTEKARGFDPLMPAASLSH